jgi:hypothetical protein
MNEDHVLNHRQKEWLVNAFERYVLVKDHYIFPENGDVNDFPEDGHYVRVASFLKAIQQALLFDHTQMKRLNVHARDFFQPFLIAEEEISYSNTLSEEELRYNLFKDIQSVVSPDSLDFQDCPIPPGNEKKRPSDESECLFYSWSDVRLGKKIFITPDNYSYWHPERFENKMLVWEISSTGLPDMVDKYNSESDTEDEDKENYKLPDIFR